MKNYFYIYLAGNIKKGKEDDHELVWSEDEKEVLKQALPELELVFLNPASRSDDLSDQKSVFGRDLFQVYSSQLVLVDTRGKRGLGVGAEMMFAKMQHIPVVSWLPFHSHYHRHDIHLLGQHISNWIHPFVYNLSDYLAPSLEDAARWISQELLTGKSFIKGSDSLSKAMQYYIDTQLENDQEMYNLLQHHEELLEHAHQLSTAEVPF